MADPNHATPGSCCTHCGYTSKPGYRNCNLCGSFLYVAAEDPAEVGAHAEPASVEEAPSPVEAAPDPGQPVARLLSVSLDEPDAPAAVERDDIYAAPAAGESSASASRSISMGDDEHGGTGAAELATASPPALAHKSTARPSPLSTLDLALPAPNPAPPGSAPPDTAAQEPYVYRPGSREAAEDLRKLHKARKFKRRLWGRWLGHGLTGILLCFGVNFLFGLPNSLRPSIILLNALGALAFGFPLGFTISWLNAGLFKGILIGAFFGGLYIIPLVALAMVAGGGQIGLVVLIVGMLSGIIPGGLMGCHVDMDR